MKNPKIVIPLIYLVRIAVVFTLFLVHPLIAVGLITLADMWDGLTYKFWLGISTHTKLYQYSDKFLDYVYYVGLIIYLFQADAVLLPLFVVLYIYRTIGDVIFWITYNRKVLLFFPNFFEYFVIAYFIVEELAPQYISYDLNYIVPVVGGISVFKIGQEYFLHSKEGSVASEFVIPAVRKLKELFK